MLAVEHRTFISTPLHTRIRIYFTIHDAFIVSIIIFLCKIIVFVGLVITIVSDHWAINPLQSNIHTGYKKRCTVHGCIQSNIDPTWLIEFIFVLAIINLFIELINVAFMCYSHNKIGRQCIALELMFFLTFIITDCGIVYSCHMTSYVYRLPMGYAYYCFICAVVFSIIDWGFSLQRLTLGWFNNHVVFRNSPTTDIDPFRRLSSIQEEEPISLSYSQMFDNE